MTIKDNENAIKSLNESIKELRLLIVGNGKVGVVEAIRQFQKELEITNKRVGIIESDTKQTKSMVEDMVGYKGVRYDEGIHPGRRKADGDKKEKTMPDKVLEWIVDKVLPILLVGFIVFIASRFFELIATHWPL